MLAAEVLMITPYVRDCIIDPDKTSLIADAIATGGSQYGMQTFDQDILRLVQSEIVTIDDALRWVTNVEEFKMKLRGITSGSAASTVTKPEADGKASTLAAAREGVVWVKESGSPGCRLRAPW